MKNIKTYEEIKIFNKHKKEDPYGEEDWNADIDTVLRDIRSMGYRKMKENVYGKPVGFSLFTIEIKGTVLTFTDWFMSVGENVEDRKIHIWNSNNLDFANSDENGIISFIKTSEAYARINVGSPMCEFEFFNKKEMSEILL